MADTIDTTLSPLGKDDILDELMKDDAIPEGEGALDLEVKDDKDEVKDDDPEALKLDDIEDEVKIDELDFRSTPARAEILKEFPDLFKKFPTIEHAIYKEKQYTEIFPTLDDAREAAEAVGSYKAIESDLLNGNIENLLTEVKSSDSKAFSKITGSILQTLERVDKDSYINTINHISKNLIITAFQSGKDSNDEQLQIAAQLIHKFIYGNHNITPNAKVEQVADPREEELNNKQQTFHRERLESAVNEVGARADNTIESTVKKYIDPKNVMTSYVRDKAIADVMSEVRKEIKSDKRFQAILDKHWQKAFSSGYTTDSKEAIRKVILSKATTVLRPALQRVKAAALKGQAGRNREAGESKDDRPIERGRPASASASKGSVGKDGKVPKNMSSLDYLNAD